MKELVKLKAEHRIIDDEILENWKMMTEWRKKWIQCDDERYEAMTLSLSLRGRRLERPRERLRERLRESIKIEI